MRATKKSSSPRDRELALVAREKAASPGIGHPLWHSDERIEQEAKLDVVIYGEPETVTLLWTSSKNIRGVRKNGRLLIASDRSANYIFGGAFFIEEHSRRCIQSIWIEPEYRLSARHTRTGVGSGVDFGDVLAEMGKQIKVSCVLEPVSTSGKAWAKRHGFRVRK